MNTTFQKIMAVIALGFYSIQSTFAQTGTTGITTATVTLRGYVDPISTLILVIGGIVGFVGAIRVYIRWNNGEQSTNKEIMSWFGSCIFLALIGVVIRSFFGV